MKRICERGLIRSGLLYIKSTQDTGFIYIYIVWPLDLHWLLQSVYITTIVCEFYSYLLWGIQHYLIKFVSYGTYGMSVGFSLGNLGAVMDLQLPICNQCLSPLTLWVGICSGQVYSIQHYVIKFVSDFRQVGGFSRYSGFLHQ